MIQRYNNDSIIENNRICKTTMLLESMKRRIIKAALNTLAMKIDVKIPFGNDE